MISDLQKDVVDFLSSPENVGGAEVARIDTHLSHVFLAGDRAFKLKRALKYDFADLSTAERRRLACENEVRINRRTAPGMYLGLRPVYRGACGVSWRGDGEPVDWVVEMKRFGAGRQFDILVSRGEIDESMIARLADKIARFHLGAERPASRDRRADSGAVIRQISAALREGEIGAARREDVAQWTDLALAEYARRKPLLDARARHGWVRRCHGDLHLANICLFEGEPTPFDAIEFNEELATIDVLYDLAFLLMDFAHFGRADFANLALNRYLGVTRDYAGAGLLPLFLSMRAGVRAMVLSLPGHEEAMKRRAGRYFDLARACLSPAPGARLIAVGGYSGSGKSTLAAGLALKFDAPAGAILLQSDVIRKRLHGADPETRLDESAYSKAASEAVYLRMLKDAGRALRAGRTVILDATFLDPHFREKAKSLARKAGAPFDGVWLAASRERLLERVSKRTGGVSDADAKVLARQLETAEPPADWRMADAGRDPREALNEAMRMLDRRGR